MSTFHIESLDSAVFAGSRNRLDEGNVPSIEGAKAVLDTFYHAFNTRNLSLFTEVWLDHPLIQLNNPLGGIMRGAEDIEELYRKVFQGNVFVTVELHDIILYSSSEHAVFAGRERGTYRIGSDTYPLNIRTTRFFQYIGSEVGWRQIHHHGSIDDSLLLRNYQKAVSGA